MNRLPLLASPAAPCIAAAPHAPSAAARASSATRASHAAPYIAYRSVHRPPLRASPAAPLNRPPPRASPTAPCIACRPFASPTAPCIARRLLMVRNAAQCNPHCAYVSRPGPVRAALPPGALFPLRRRGLTRLEPIRRHALLCASVVAGATRHDRPRGCKTWRAPFTAQRNRLRAGRLNIHSHRPPRIRAAVAAFVPAGRAKLHDCQMRL